MKNLVKLYKHESNAAFMSIPDASIVDFINLNLGFHYFELRKGQQLISNH